MEDGGIVSRGFPLLSVPIGAWLDEADGGRRFITGTGAGDGKLTIPQVPAGLVMVRIGPNYLVTQARSFDLSYQVFGRPDAVRATINPTPLRLDATNLAPWSAKDSLTLLSPNAGAQLEGFQRYGTGAPTVGANSVAGFSLNYFVYSSSGFATPLIEGSKNDRAWLIQRSQTFDAGLGQDFIVRAWQPPSFTMADGQTTALSGALSSVPTSQITYTLQSGDFAALAPQLTPSTTASNLLLVSFGIGVQGPVTNASRVYATLADTYAIEPSVLPSAFDLPNPFPSNWGLAVRVEYQSLVSRQLAGTTTPLYLNSSVQSVMAYGEFTSMPVAPRLGPVTNARVNGAAFGANQTGIGLTPTLTWSPPSLGSAKLYQLLVYRLAAQAGQTVVAATQYLQTAQTAVTLPPGMLTTGQTYLLKLDAADAPGLDDSLLYGRRLPSHSAGIVSGLLTP